MKKVYYIATGHSPREDITVDMNKYLSSEIETVELGAMDGFTVEQVKTEFAPQDGKPTMVSRFRSGEMLAFDEEKAMPYVQDAVKMACEDGADLIIILCTSHFPELKSTVPILYPGKLMHAMVPTMAKGMKVSYLFPFQSHAEGMQKDWEADGMPGNYACYHPASGESPDAAMEFLRKDDAGLVVLDCIGFPVAFAEQVVRETGKPAILPRKLLVNMTHTLLGL